MTELEIDRQVLAVFDKMRIEGTEVRDWFRAVFVSQTKDAQVNSHAQRAELQRQESFIVAQQQFCDGTDGWLRRNGITQNGVQRTLSDRLSRTRLRTWC